MIHIKGWKLTNIVYYERATVRLNAPLVVVRGKNLNSRNKGQNNGAGKSLLCFPVPNILRGSPPISARKKGRKDILGKKSCAYIDFVTHDNKRIEVYQHAGKYEVLEDGRDLEIKAIPTAEKQIQKYFPLNEQEFYSTVYIRTIPLEFQIGTPADRLKFISDLFRLDAYDALRKHFNEKLKLIRDQESRFSVLSANLAKVDKELAALKWSKSKKAKLDSDAKQHEEIRSRLRIIADEIHEQEILLTNIDTALSLKSQLAKLGYKDGLDVKSKLSDLLSVQRRLSDYNAYVKALARYKESTQRIRDDLEALTLPKESRKSLKSLYDSTQQKLEDAQQHLEELRDEHNRWKRYISRKETLQESLTELGYASVKKVPKGDVQDDIAQARTILSLKRLLHEHDGESKCPTCLSDIDLKTIRANVKEAESRIQQLVKIADAQAIVAKLKALEPIEFDESQLKRCRKDIDKAQELLTSIRSDLDIYREHARLTELLESIVKPERVEKLVTKHTPESLQSSISALHKMRSLLASVARLQDVADLREDLDKQKRIADKKVVKLKEEESQYVDILNALTDSVRQLEQELAQFKLLYAQSVDLKQQMAEIEKAVEQKQILEALVNAYGPKGLKVTAIKNICSMLESNFNMYSPYIYNEDFQFKITVEPTGILVDVDRGKSFISDVRMLSGAESDCFKLMFLTSLLPLMPSERRVDTLILDEPDSHMDPVSREKFIHDFLPQLQAVVPHILVITPNQDDYPNAEEWTVVKDGKKSELVIA